MTLNNLLLVFSDDFYVYYQMLFICVLIMVIALICKFSETKIITSGIYLFAGCMAINFVLSFFSETYWYFILHWFLASLSFFIFWYLIIYICENFGQPYSRDGGMVMVMPLYFLFFGISSSLLIKAFTVILHLF